MEKGSKVTEIDLEAFGKNLETLAEAGNRFAASLLVAWKDAQSEDAKRVVFQMAAGAVKNMAEAARKIIDEYDHAVVRKKPKPKYWRRP
jgi:hypothetical protein